MYIRRNRVKFKFGPRYYLSISHNVWRPKDENKKGGSTPIRIVSIGRESDVDFSVARDIVTAIERIFLIHQFDGSEKAARLMKAAASMRAVEPLLKQIAAIGSDFSKHHHDDRSGTIESMIREKIENE